MRRAFTPVGRRRRRLALKPYRGASCLDSVDMLDVAEGTWAHAGSLLHPRCGLALALDARRSDLWVCGSSSGANRAASGCQRWCVAACERPIGDVHPGPKSAVREAFFMQSEVLNVNTS